MLVLLLISGIVTEYIKAISRATEIAVGLQNIYCLEQYVISVINFKNCFGIHKSDIFFFFSIWVFFHEHSRFTGQQGKGEGIFLTPLYHFHPLHRHLDISPAITAESSPLLIAGSRTRTGNLWLPSASR